jgi:hypothetical protein
VQLQGTNISALIPHRGGRETKGRSREREWTHQGGDPAAGGAWHERHCDDGWNRWRRWLDDRRRKMVGERAGIRPKAEWAWRAGPKRKLGQRRIKSRKMKIK